jgi:hypothetical protein
MNERGIDKARRELNELKTLNSAADMWKTFEQTMTMGIKLKKVMQKRGITAAKAKCEACDGYLHGALVGKKQHLHMHCDGPCKAVFTE